MLKTYVYIDGYNFYYGAVKGTPFKWLNLSSFCRNLLPQSQVLRINYYTARAGARPGDLDVGKRQREFLRALGTLGDVFVHYGQFKSRPKNMPLYDAMVYDDMAMNKLIPQHYARFSTHPRVKMVTVLKTEEKGSDVNLASHLVRDACDKAFEAACVFTNDSDLAEPIRIAVQEKKLPVSVWLKDTVAPVSELQAVAKIYRFKNADLKANQLPLTLTDKKGTPIKKPASW